jgi:hypothetical protein
MSIADEQTAQSADRLERREESKTMNAQHDDRAQGHRLRWLVAEIGYRLVSLGAWLERFGPKRPES